MNIGKHELNNLGFFKFDFLSNNKIAALQALYDDRVKLSIDYGMAVSHNNGDSNSAILLSQEINNLLVSELANYFPDYRFFLAHFAIKKAQCELSFQLHKDWNITEEKEGENIQLWIPLELSYPENGGMCFIPRSHLFNTGYRSGSFGIPHIPIVPELYPYLSYTRLLPGEAVAFYNNTLHGSFSNATNKDRVALLVNLVKKGTPTYYYHLNHLQRQCEKYSIDAATLLTYLPELEKGKLPFKFQPTETTSISVNQNNNLITTELIRWIKRDRHLLELPDDYEFKQYNIIKDATLEKQINHKGYAIIDLIEEDEINKLKKGFEKFFPDRSLFKGRYSSMDNQPNDIRKQIHIYIQSVIKNKLNIHFYDYYSPISILYSKRADGVADTDWHSDPHFILNQHLEPLYAIWCPLVKVNQENGVLNVIPHSHRFLNDIIHPLIPWSFAPKRRDLDKLGISFNLNAGQAIIYDARLIHSSPPNISKSDRDCFVMRLAHKNSSYMSIYVSDNVSKADIYRQTEDFFFDEGAINHNLRPNTGIFSGSILLYKKDPFESDFMQFSA